MGTKRTLVSTGHAYIGQGKLDGASIVIVPILGDQTHIRGLLLMQVSFNENLSIKEKIDVLDNKFNDIKNLINEYNLPWEDQYLGALPVAKLLSESAEIIAGQILGTLKGSDNGFDYSAQDQVLSDRREFCPRLR